MLCVKTRWFVCEWLVGYLRLFKCKDLRRVVNRVHYIELVLLSPEPLALLNDCSVSVCVCVSVCDGGVCLGGIRSSRGESVSI